MFHRVCWPPEFYGVPGVSSQKRGRTDRAMSRVMLYPGRAIRPSSASNPRRFDERLRRIEHFIGNDDGTLLQRRCDWLKEQVDPFIITDDCLCRSESIIPARNVENPICVHFLRAFDRDLSRAAAKRHRNYPFIFCLRLVRAKYYGNVSMSKFQRCAETDCGFSPCEALRRVFLRPIAARHLFGLVIDHELAVGEVKSRR